MARRPRAADRPEHYTAEQVRGSEIVLRTRAERMIFIAGLAGAVIVAWLLSGI